MDDVDRNTIRRARQKIRDKDDVALSKIVLAYAFGRGVRLTANEVAQLYRNDDSLRTRFWQEETNDD